MGHDHKPCEPVFGSWYIKKKIGSGGNGCVYEIERTDEFGVSFQSALKVITIPYGGEDEIKSVLFSGVSEEELKSYYEKVADSVINEFRCMSKLKGNGHIVSYEDHQIIAHQNDPGWDILMRMELLTPLHEYYRGCQMQESDILKMGVDLCKGLEFCHQSGIIHRDIKPENIFVAPSGDYKLGDFGIAKIVEQSQTYLSCKGTFTYMAPEVYRGEHYDETADIYSLGMVLYQCLNDGRCLFMPPMPESISHSDNEEAFAKRIVRREIPLPAHGSEQLKLIVQKACAYDPCDRYQSAKAMRLDLEELFLGTERSNASADGARMSKAARSISPGISGKPRSGSGRKIDAKARPRHLIILAIAILLIGGSVLVYTLIPHEIESIEGISDQNVIYIGDTLQPKYKILPERFADETISFSVSDESVAGVNELGAITALALGSAELTLSADGYTRSVNVTVIPKVTMIENISSTIELEVGSTETLKPELSPAEFSDEEITWTIENPSVALISSNDGENGQSATGSEAAITALAAGATTLKIEAGGCTLVVNVITTEPPPPPEPTYYSEPVSSSVSRSSSASKSKSSKSKSESSTDDRGYFLDSDKEHF